MADTLEVRIAHLEGAYEQIDKRLAGVESAVFSLRQEVSQEIGQLRQELNGEMNGLRQEMNELRRQVTEQFRWIVGIQILAWISILGTLLGLLFRQ